MRNHHSRGSVLFTVLIVVLAITLLGTALIVGSGRHLASARIRESNVGLANCALAVRQLVAANVVGGTAMTTLNFTIPATGGATGLQAIKIVGGHYGNADGGSVLAGGPSFGQKGGSSVQNIANAMPMVLGSGTTQQTGTAVCTDGDGKTYEVEFSYVGQ
jgi:hypothetical protein